MRLIPSDSLSSDCCVRLRLRIQKGDPTDVHLPGKNPGIAPVFRQVGQDRRETRQLDRVLKVSRRHHIPLSIPGLQGDDSGMDLAVASEIDSLRFAPFQLSRVVAGALWR